LSFGQAGSVGIVYGKQLVDIGEEEEEEEEEDEEEES